MGILHYSLLQKNNPATRVSLEARIKLSPDSKNPLNIPSESLSWCFTPEGENTLGKQIPKNISELIWFMEV
jgi:hypothetical protein